jgi:hypothetical protein
VEPARSPATPEVPDGAARQIDRRIGRVDDLHELPGEVGPGRVGDDTKDLDHSRPNAAADVSLQRDLHREARDGTAGGVVAWMFTVIVACTGAVEDGC